MGTKLGMGLEQSWIRLSAGRGQSWTMSASSPIQLGRSHLLTWDTIANPRGHVGHSRQLTAQRAELDRAASKIGQPVKGRQPEGKQAGARASKRDMNGEIDRPQAVGALLRGDVDQPQTALDGEQDSRGRYAPSRGSCPGKAQATYGTESQTHLGHNCQLTWDTVNESPGPQSTTDLGHSHQLAWDRVTNSPGAKLMQERSWRGQKFTMKRLFLISFMIVCVVGHCAGRVKMGQRRRRGKAGWGAGLDLGHSHPIPQFTWDTVTHSDGTQSVTNSPGPQSPTDSAESETGHGREQSWTGSRAKLDRAVGTVPRSSNTGLQSGEGKIMDQELEASVRDPGIRDLSLESGIQANPPLEIRDSQQISLGMSGPGLDSRI